MTKKDKVTVDDIIGIVKCEQTDSVEEVRKLRGRNERFIVDDAGTLIDIETRNTYDYVSEVLPLLNEQNNAINELINSEKYWEKKATQRINEITKENEQLKQFQDRVFSWIDMHLQRLPTLIDKEFNSDNEFADPSLYSGALQILETMKKELKGDSE